MYLYVSTHLGCFTDVSPFLPAAIFGANLEIAVGLMCHAKTGILVGIY
jgi:hypothetical protein